MTATYLPVCAIGASLAVSVAAYWALARSERSHINIMTPYFLTSIPAFYLLPLVYLNLFGADTTVYSYFWVYSALAVESVCFVYAYIRTGDRVKRFPGISSYGNFGTISLLCLLAGILLYVPVLIQFREFLLDPRQIYMQTRTGFGAQAFVSSTLAYIAVILVLFARRSWLVKTLTILAAAVLLLLHGSKAQVLSIIFILLLYYVYGLRRKVTFVRAVVFYIIVAAVGIGLFAATMTLGEDIRDVAESVSEYADYTRNAMLVIDSHFPRQYGRLTIESNTLAVIPRQLMPGKPKNFGSFSLAEEFYPEWFDKDTGSPAFGVGVQYADFGPLAIFYLAFMAALKGWLARIFVNRLRLTNHPADFFMLVFLADIAVFPVGVGWLLPEALLVCFLLRLLSSLGASRVYRDARNYGVLPQIRSLNPTGGNLAR